MALCCAVVMMAALSRDQDIIKWMPDISFERVDNSFDKSQAFMKELAVGYADAAEHLLRCPSVDEPKGS